MYVPVITSHEYILMSLSGGGGDSPSEVPCAPILAIEDPCVGDLTEVVLRAGVKVCEGEGRKKLGGGGWGWRKSGLRQGPWGGEIGLTRCSWTSRQGDRRKCWV